MEHIFEKFSREQLILGGAIIAVTVIIFIVVKSLMSPPPPPPEETTEPEKPVYEIEIGNIKFKLKEVKDRGSVLPISEARYRERENLTTTEKFIEITVEVQNIGKDEIRAGRWDIKDVIDSEGRRFYYEQRFNSWVPETSECGETLKPGFTPKTCTKIYEIAKVSSGLKVKVSVRGVDADYIDLGI